MCARAFSARFLLSCSSAVWVCDVIMNKFSLLSSSASSPYGRITVPRTSRLVFDDTGPGGPAIELDTLGIQINVSHSSLRFRSPFPHHHIYSGPPLVSTTPTFTPSPRPPPPPNDRVSSRQARRRAGFRARSPSRYMVATGTSAPRTATWPAPRWLTSTLRASS